MKAQRLSYVWLVMLMGVIVVGLAAVLFGRTPQNSQILVASPPASSVPQATLPTNPPSTIKRAVNILVDDFQPQPYPGEAVYYFNRLDGDRGAINNSRLDWGPGEVTTTISSGNVWGGVWLSLNHPIREGLALNFAAILPSQILPDYQSQITGLTAHIARGTPRVTFRLELKYHGDLQWKHEVELTGGDQMIGLDLPPLGNVNELLWVLDRASAGDYAVIDRVSFTATTAITDTALAAFVWSYGQLLNNWNPATGLIRDKAKDASNEFDAIQATGSLAAATSSAEQLGVIDHAAAVAIVDRIGRALLSLPRWHGLWPHWVTTSPVGESAIVFGTEWSSVDTVIAAFGLLDAQSALGLDTTATEQTLHAIDWADLATAGGVAHGYAFSGDRLPYAWDVFGGESWLVELASASVTGQVIALTYPTPPTANGSGFIDELAWLYVAPPDRSDYWGTDWAAYRSMAAQNQLAYYVTQHPIECASELGLFGLSAAEAPVPASGSPSNIYQAFGVGGRFAAANDGTAQSGGPVIVPHYAALTASLDPQASVKLWAWLIGRGYFTPLTDVESLSFSTRTPCDEPLIQWNSLKGSWNLALQTLGWGRYLAERNGQVPSMWQATKTNALLQHGYRLLVPDRTAPASTPRPIPTTAMNWTFARECEQPDEATVGQVIERPNASGAQVQGQFGTTAAAPWSAQTGYVQYNNVSMPDVAQLSLQLRYSKNTAPTVPIAISLDAEPSIRAMYWPTNQGDWNTFTWSGSIALGSIKAGVHSIKFFTPGQQYGVADLDQFVLSAQSAAATPSAAGVTPVVTAPPASDLARVYFSVGATLYRMKLDGSELETISAGMLRSEYLAADAPHHRLYISRWNSMDQILVLDTTTDRLSGFDDGPTIGNGGGQGLAIDAAAAKMFSGIYYSGISVRDLAPDQNWWPVVVSDQLAPLLGQRGQLQLDAAHQQIYFRTAFNGECGECRFIYRLNYAGDDLIKLVPANGGDALALDLVERKLYFSDVPGNGTIKRANLDGSHVETIMTLPAPDDFCRSIVIDAAHRQMFLSLLRADGVTHQRTIARANLDGADLEVLFQLAADTEAEVMGGLDLFLP